jgi:hypothetical protein
MDRKNMILIAGSAALAVCAVVFVTAASQASATPLFTVRMEQVSSKMNFLPTEINGFTYDTEKGYTVTFGINKYCSSDPSETILDDTCMTMCGTCPFSCLESCFETCDTWPSCPVTCDTCTSNCNPTCYGPTCPQTCEPTCETPTCPHTCYETCETCDDPTCPYTCYETCEDPTCPVTCEPTCEEPTCPLTCDDPTC